MADAEEEELTEEEMAKAAELAKCLPCYPYIYRIFESALTSQIQVGERARVAIGDDFLLVFPGDGGNIWQIQIGRAHV